MLISRFLKQLDDYGTIRLLTSPDIKAATTLTLFLLLLDETSCYVYCVNFENSDVVANTTPLLTALLSFVIVSLSIVVSFTDEDFLGKLSKLRVYQNILFIFLFNIMLVATTVVGSIILAAYNLSMQFFYGYLFLFLWSVFSTVGMMQLVVNIGLNKAKHEEEKDSPSK